MKKTVLISLLLLSVLTSCDTHKNEGSQLPADKTMKPAALPAPASAAPPLLSRPTEIDIVEMPGDALPIWRRYRDQQPTIVIFANDPMLMGINPEVIPQVTALVEHGQRDDFLRKGRTQLADPVFLPEQTLTAALHSKFFSRIVWILPPPGKDEELSADILRKKMFENGILSEGEAAELILTDGLYQGTLQGLPFQFSATGQLPRIDGPVVLHLDFDFFNVQYRNEVTAPIFPLIQKMLVALKQTGWHTLTTTCAIATEEGETPLELRFIKLLLAEIFANPTMLDKELPEPWTLRKAAIYNESFFQPEASLDQYLHMEEISPKDASVKYDIYRTLIMLKEREDAYSYLNEAIQLDKGYAFEYIKLANSARAKDRLAETLAHLEKARALLPDNPFVRLEIANIMMQLGKRKEARSIVRELQALPWSSVFYPNTRVALKELEGRLDRTETRRN